MGGAWGISWGRVALAFWAANITGIAAAALQPNESPGANFNLSHWYLTLPDAGPTIIPPAQLVTGYTNASWFYTGTDGAMVFWAPVTGGHTANSEYARSELRERIEPTANNVNWTGYGTHILDAQCRVTRVPSNGKVMIGQIHSYTGNAYPLLMLMFEDGASLYAKFRSSPNSRTDTYLTFSKVALNSLITYQIKMSNGLVSVTVNGQTLSKNAFTSDPDWTNQTFYFKAGAYCQDNEGSSSEGARVAF